MSETKVIVDITGNRTIEIATGKLAKLANGSCTVRLGDTVLLVAVCSGPPREGADFFPLQVDYREKYSAAGRFPGGYIKREGRPSTKEILTCRVTDRPLRPLFPEGFFDEVQIQALLLSADRENEADVLCMLGASVALTLSDLPFKGPIGALRVGYIDGNFVANPTQAQMAKSELDLIYAGTPDKVIMIEGEAKECSEKLLKDAMEFANDVVRRQVKSQLELAEKAGRPKKEPNLYKVPETVKYTVGEFCSGKLEKLCLIPGKEERQNALDELFAKMIELLSYELTDVEDKEKLPFHMQVQFDMLVKKTIRNAIMNKNFRPDGRGPDELRPIESEVDILPVVHGSGLFSRGETQALVIATLGGTRDTQDSDSITSGDISQKFYLHYNFPNFSVGEVGRIMGPGRREIGHGNLAERSLAQVIPEDFPYTIRLISEIMASNGSTSMASVCGGTLALMDAGVPISGAVAGISCGLISENDRDLILTDILGMEDHFGDMDFKVCGTRKGITGFQLDLKLDGISIDLLVEAMEQNRNARMKILDIMQECIAEPRAEINENAPRVSIMHINPEKIGAVIGPGGKMIKELSEETDSKIDIEDDGTVKIFTSNQQSLEDVTKRIEDITAEAELNKVYRGKVVSVKDFGAFVEIFPGQEGLLHISELANYRVDKVTDICKEGEPVTVKVIEIDQKTGKIRLSRKAALEEIE